jgi:hypothetical protein
MGNNDDAFRSAELSSPLIPDSRARWYTFFAETKKAVMRDDMAFTYYRVNQPGSHAANFQTTRLAF